MNRKTFLKLFARASGLAGTALYAAHSLAAGSSMPWEVPLQSILTSIQGPVAKIVAVIIIGVAESRVYSLVSAAGKGTRHRPSRIDLSIRRFHDDRRVSPRALRITFVMDVPAHRQRFTGCKRNAVRPR